MDNTTSKYPIVKRKIGKKYLQMEESHKLPIYYEDFPFYDRALPRICKKIKDLDGYLAMIDIGANIGDSVSLVTDEVSGSFLCVEGDEEFLPFLKENTHLLKGSVISIEESYCSENDDVVDSLEINRENGTAKIVSTEKGSSTVNAKFKTLNSIIEKHPLFKNANLLKIDTDGFEINILKGGEEFLKKATPVLYFEFTPEFYIDKNQDPLFIFDFLNRNGYKKALMYDNFGKPIRIVDTNDSNEIKELIEAIDNHAIYYYDILTYHDSKKEKYNLIFNNELLACFNLSGVELFSVKSELASAKSELENSRLKLVSIEDELRVEKNEVQLAKLELNEVYNSREWRLVLILKKIAETVMPKKSLRRILLVRMWRLIKIPFKFAFKVVRKIRSSVSFCVGCFAKLKPRKKRKINKNSKKIVYIGHSYHNKTKSTAFLIDYLREFYEVEVILDESWRGNGELYPDLSFIDDSYLAVLFFQNLPNENLLKNIKNENIVFFPMYDGVGHDYDYWGGLHALKIINFSKTLHEKLIKWGFESIAVQYFPESQTFIPGKKDEVFFWQRLTKMNIDVIEKLFGDEKIEMHIHKAIDPNQEFKQPNDEQENKFKITYSDWFETREEMWDLIKQKGIYIAPRELEGIGMSFLEAMAMGKAVIAVDNPTMNEYIKHGENGYLFNLKNPKKIDLSNIEKVQKNTYAFMQDGFKKWEKNKHNIIQFIEKQ